MKIEQKDWQKSIDQSKETLKWGPIAGAGIAVLGIVMIELGANSYTWQNGLFFCSMGISLIIIGLCYILATEFNKQKIKTNQMIIKTFYDKNYVPEDYLIETKEKVK